MHSKTNFWHFFWRFLFISILGTLLHFTWEWSDRNPFVALFSAVNESTWEHLKLLFFPMLLLTLLELFFSRTCFQASSRKSSARFSSPHTLSADLAARTVGILSGMFFITAGYYTLLGVIGKNYDVLNILLYFAGVLFALWIENRQYRTRFASKIPPVVPAFILLLLTLAFFCFTFQAPDIGLFREP